MLSVRQSIEGTLSILVVDDDAVDYRLLSRLFNGISRWHVVLSWATGLEAALAQLTDHHYDLCLVDYQLPEGDGTQLIEQATERGVEVPFVMLTGNPDPEVDQAAQRAGAWDFLVKSELRSTTLERCVRYTLERAAVQIDLRRQARIDPLTGLANRVALRERLRASMERSEREPTWETVLLYVDLDGFKQVNDLLGHSVGDEVLHAVARRLEGALRAGDVAARVGGDEFAVLLSGPSAAAGATGAAQRVVNALSGPVGMGLMTVGVGASVGIAIATDGIGPEELIAQADAAMYAAKRRGRSGWVLHAPRRSRVPGALTLRPFLAIDDQASPLAVEVVGGDELGLATVLDWERLIREATATAAAWPDAEAAVAVALPRCTREVVVSVRLALQAAGLPPERLYVLLPEASAAVGDAPVVFQSLADLGVRTMLDGFGAGGFPLCRLDGLAVMGLRLAPELIEALHRPRRRSLLGGIVGLGHELGLEVVVTGIARPSQQVDVLRDLGCRWFQEAASVAQ